MGTTAYERLKARLAAIDSRNNFREINALGTEFPPSEKFSPDSCPGGTSEENQLVGGKHPGPKPTPPPIRDRACASISQALCEPNRLISLDYLSEKFRDCDCFASKLPPTLYNNIIVIQGRLTVGRELCILRS